MSPEGSRRAGQPILIAGGGIAGLAAAIALAREGFATRVLERRAEFQEQGAGIQIGPNGTHVLRRLGIAENLEPHVGKPQRIIVKDGTNGRTLTALPLGADIERRHGAPYWTAHRQDLHSVLLKAATGERLIEIMPGFEVSSVKSGADGVTAARDNGHASGSALIAADGLWSVARRSVPGAAAPRFSGSCAFRAVVPAHDAPRELQAPATHIWLSRSAHVVHYPVRGGREIAIVAIHAGQQPAQTWAADATAGEAAAATARFPAILKELIAAAQKWRSWGLYVLPVPDRLAAGRIALAGDAAHPVLPFLAQGGVMALEDAVTIAAMVAANQDDLVAAFAGFSRERRGRVARVAAQSERNGAIYHMEGLAAAARNATLRTLPASVLMARYDWLYGWKPG